MYDQIMKQYVCAVTNDNIMKVESYAQISSGGEVPNLSAQQVTSCTPNLLQCGGTGNIFFQNII